jgi:hypothetical protein
MKQPVIRKMNTKPPTAMPTLAVRLRDPAGGGMYAGMELFLGVVTFTSVS